MLYKWELGEWGDGTLRLTYWAIVYGKDASIVLHPDGRAELRGYTDEIDGLVEDGLVEVWTEIGDLVLFLRDWVAEIDRSL